MSDSSGDRDPVERLAESFLARYRRGERPSIDDYADQHPELADEIRELLPALVALEQDMSVDAPTTGQVASGGPKTSSATPDQLGEYLILREIGRGGMGVVYEATQQSLGRHVALKVLPGTGLGGTHLERFRLEARAAARLHHTNIVPVFGVGEAGGVHYYAMQFIRGQGLDVVIDELTRQKKALASGPAALPKPEVHAITEGLIADRFAAATTRATGPSGSGPAKAPSGSTVVDAPKSSPSGLSTAGTEGHFYKAAARVGLQVVEALAYAHGQGIIHRDIKPSNLLLDIRGNVWVTDFGLAKSEGSNGPTQTGDIVGTLRYMAPERFDGWSDPRTDIYALGATLYELLALHPVFEEANRARLIEAVLHDDPTPPRKHDPKVPRDLETIVLKALSREPAARYLTAEAMAEDLRRYLADKTILARRSSPAEKLGRWCRRNPAVAGLLGTLAAVFLLGFAAVTVAWRKADASRLVADARLIDSERSEGEAKRQKARAEAGLAQARSAVDEYLNKVTDSRPLQAPGLLALRRDLLQSGLSFYQAFLKENDDDPGLQLLEADVQLRASKVMGETSPGEAAKAAGERAIALYKKLHRDRPDDDDVTAGLADALVSRGRYYEAVSLLDPLVARRPAVTRYRRLLLGGLNSIALARAAVDDPDETLKVHLRSFEAAQALVGLEPGVAENHSKLSATLNNIAIMLDRDPIFRGEDSLDLIRHAASHAERALALDPNDRLTARFAMIQRRNIARISFYVGFIEEGLRGTEAVVETCRQLAARNPDVPLFQKELYNTLLGLASYQSERGLKSRAVATYGELLAVLTQIEERGPAGTKPTTDRGWLLTRLAEFGGEVAPAPAAPPAGTDAEAAEAVAAFDRAIRAGNRDLRWFRTSSDLNPLRARPDFEAMLGRLAAIVDAEATAPQKKAGDVTSPATTADAKVPPAPDAPPSDGRVESADVHYAAGLLFMYYGPHEEAEVQLTRALAEREALLRDHPGDARHRFRVAKVHQLLSELAQRRARLVESDRELATCRGQMDALAADNPSDRELSGLIGMSHWHLGYEGAFAGSWDVARDLLRRVEEVGIPDSYVQRSISRAYLELAFGDREEYRRIVRREVEWYRGKDNSFVAADLAKGLSLGADSGVDPAEMIRLGELGAGTEGVGYEHWMTLFLALEYYRAGRLDDAARTLDRATAHNSMIHVAPNIRAMIAHRRGHPEEARAHLKVARDAERQNIHRALGGPPTELPIGPHWMAWVESRVLSREAEGLVEGRPAREPWLPLFSARVEAARGRMAEAEALLAQAGREASDDPDLLASRARVWAEIGREPEALADLERSLRLAPSNFQALCERGRIAIKQGRLDAGIADLTRALDGRSASELGSSDERARVDVELAASEPAYRKAIAARPADFSLRQARARNLLWHRRWAEASAELDPIPAGNNADDWCVRAGLRLASGDVEGYRRLGRERLAAIGDVGGDFEEFGIARALSLAPNDVMDAGRVAARGYRALQVHPSTPWYRHAWALGLCRAGQLDLAAAQLVESLRQDRNWGGRVINWPSLALVEAKRGNVEEARVWLAKAERWAEEQGRDPDAQARAYPPKVFESDWVVVNVLIPEARQELDKAQALRDLGKPPGIAPAK